MKSSLPLYVFISVALGATLSIRQTTTTPPYEPIRLDPKPVWQPAIGSKFQIILYKGSGDRFRRNANLLPQDADIFDLDLVDTPKSTIDQLHRKGKRVICYFSAGSAEDWRSDYSRFQAKDKGDILREWNREQWLDIRSPDVFEIMRARMRLGADKGCDAVDPDNVGKFTCRLKLLHTFY
jgi:hypothetical protein